MRSASSTGRPRFPTCDHTGNRAFVVHRPGPLVCSRAMEARRPDTHNPVALIVFTVGLLASIVATLYLLSAYLTDFIMACLAIES